MHEHSLAESDAGSARKLLIQEGDASLGPKQSNLSLSGVVHSSKKPNGGASEVETEFRRRNDGKQLYMKITKSTLALGLMCAGMISLNPLAYAADKPDEAKPDAPRRERREQVRDRLEQMSKELNLSEEQKGKLKTVFQQEAERMKSLRQDTSLTPEQRREKVRGLREEFAGKIKEVLTKEQNEKWDKLREQRPDRPQRPPPTEKPK
jgi:periplasmic protein CpxP/Spy